MLGYCFEHFCRNAYILEYYNALVAIKERSNGLQEDKDKVEEKEELKECPYPYLSCSYDSDSNND